MLTFIVFSALLVFNLLTLERDIGRKRWGSASISAGLALYFLGLSLIAWFDWAVKP